MRFRQYVHPVSGALRKKFRHSRSPLGGVADRRQERSGAACPLTQG
jgi:hypothetical protein